MADTSQLDWIALLEAHRPDYLAEARAAARRLLESRQSITVNDVREVCPPPADIDGRVMGAIFRHRDFEAVDNVRSSRSACHHREIKRFALTNYAKVHAALGLKKT